MRYRLGAFCLLSAACGPTDQSASALGPGGKADCADCEVVTVPSVEDDLVTPGQRDTGYYSNLAGEIMGTFTGRLVLRGETKEELREGVRNLVEDTFAYTFLFDSQIALAKNTMLEKALHLNLSTSAAKIISSEVDEAALIATIQYELSSEGVVSYEELAKQDPPIKLEDVLNQTLSATVLADPREPITRLARIAEKDTYASCSDVTLDISEAKYERWDQCLKPLVEECASGFEGPLENHNFFYYFNPTIDKDGDGKSDCQLGEMSQVTFVARDSAQTKVTLPEFDRLRKPWTSSYGTIGENGETVTHEYSEPQDQLSFVVLFGAADHDDDASDDYWGMSGWRKFNYTLTQRGFENIGPYTTEYVRKTDDGPLEKRDVGRRWLRDRNAAGQSCTFGQPGCVRVVADVISPVDLHDLSEYSREHSDEGLFHQALRTHEVLVYAGHSFYGSLDVLDVKENYPEGVYQIVFMSSCWSYEYYTKQVFANKMSDDDASYCDREHGCPGWALTDVVNDTQMGWFHNYPEMVRVVFENLAAGIEVQGYDTSTNRAFTWNNIITKMNDIAVRAQSMYKTDAHEIFGVSGVRTNTFCPAALEEECGRQE